MNFDDILSRSYNNQEFLIDFLKENNLIYEPICPYCNNTCTPNSNNSFDYRCNRSFNGRRCMFKRSLLHGSIFGEKQVSLRTIILIIDNWRKGVISEIVSIDCYIDRTTVTRYYQKMDEIIIWNVENFGEKLIGGPGVIVEVDECLCVKRKYNRGRILRNQVWVFGGVERGNNTRYFIEVVESRSRVRLCDVLRRRVRDGSIIMTDLWRGYTNLSIYLYEKGFLHHTVNHSVNFVDPDTGAYTQSVEAFWSVYKRIVRKRGSNVGDATRRINLYHVYRFLMDNRRNMLFEILEVIKMYTLYELP